MAQIQDGGNESTLDPNIFRVYTRTSRNILILMFCTSLGQCKVNVGCHLLNSGKEKTSYYFFKFSFQNFREAIMTPSITSCTEQKYIHLK